MEPPLCKDGVSVSTCVVSINSLLRDSTFVLVAIGLLCRMFFWRGVSLFLLTFTQLLWCFDSWTRFSLCLHGLLLVGWWVGCSLLLDHQYHLKSIYALHLRSMISLTLGAYVCLFSPSLLPCLNSYGRYAQNSHLIKGMIICLLFFIAVCP